MEPALLDLLAELENFGKENDAMQGDRAKKMLNLERETAEFITLLIRSSQSKQLLEIGTSNGYSTLWLAWAAQQTNGHIISLERDEAKQVLADENLRRAGLRDRVDLRLGDATTLVSELAGPFDFVFFDADRISASAQLKIIQPKLTAGALVLADNALSHPEEIAPYLDYIASRREFDHLVVPIGKGLSLAYLA